MLGRRRGSVVVLSRPVYTVTRPVNPKPAERAIERPATVMT